MQQDGGEFLRTPRQFLNVSRGKLVNKKDEKFLDGYIGKVTEIKFVTDTFEGQPQPKWKVILKNMASAEGVEAQIAFKADAYYALGWFRRILNVNIARPFLMGVYRPKDGNDKISLCYMRQDEQKIEANKDTVRDPVKVTVGTKEILDWTDALDDCHKVAAELTKRIHVAHISSLVGNGGEVSDGKPPEGEGELPF